MQNSQQNPMNAPHHSVSRIVLAALALIVVLAAGSGGYFVYSKVMEEAPPSSAKKGAKMVTAAPFDFEQIAGISKFRSCAGHDYSGKDIDNQAETLRSMKNYVAPLPSLAGQKDTVALYAPFDGVVINNSVGKLDYNFDLMPENDRHWVYELGHVSTPTMKVGDHVKAGQLIGYFNQENAFDVQFWYGGKKTVNTLNGYLDSLFAHMTPELAATFASYGLTPENLVVSKEYRDAHPCAASGDVKLDSVVFKSTFADDYVMVANKAALTADDLQKASEKGPAGGAAPANGGSGNAACADSVPEAERPPGCSN